MNPPRVSLLVAMRNEAQHIEGCLVSLLEQDYPAEKLEVLVLDGESTDGSWQIVERMLEGRANFRLIRNSGITQAHGWNLGIEHATGDVIGIVSAHAELAPDYVSRAIETLERTGADLVGGPARKRGTGTVGQAVAVATSSRFGVGGARFHYTEKEEEVDTVYMGLCRREVYARIGGFDVEMVRNQDDELSYRLLERGGRIVCNPAIRSLYHNRASLGALWRQYFQYGYWKVRVMQKHPRQMQPRQFVPPGFVAVLLGSGSLALFSPAGRVMLGFVGGSYALANVAASIVTAGRQGWRHLGLLPVVFAILHFGYGLGFLRGAVEFAVGARRT